MPSPIRQGNILDASEISAALQHTPFARHVHHLAEVASTNDLALEAAHAGEAAGIWVADAQTAGRGRGGHTWLSAPGEGLYVSALFTPQLPATAFDLSLAAGLAAWQAIRDICGLTVDIRWPNDLVTRERGSRKLGGILVETAVAPREAQRGPMLRYAVIGIGLNVAHRAFPPELAGMATSLFLEGWQRPDRQPLLIALLHHLCSNVGSLEAAHAGHSSPGEVLSRLAQASTWLQGKRVEVPEEGGYTGVTAGLDANGFLLVDTAGGVRRTVRSGGVRELP